MTPRLLIACIGNIFLGDDAFGCEVARRLSVRSRPEGVRLVDFGIRGFDLALALLDEAVDVAILVDAVPRGEPPGTLYLIEPDWEAGADVNEPTPFETHSLDPVKVLRLVLTLGGRSKRVLLVGCEPTPFDEDNDPPADLSSPVQEALDEAVRMVESLVVQIREGREVIAMQ
ncbi:hydrogenase maturation protease [Isosphaeraceae bacterium EP7]